MSIESEILQQIEITNKLLTEIIKQLSTIEKELPMLNNKR